jgi:hypothetical protein
MSWSFPPRTRRVCFVIAVEKAARQTFGFTHNPGRLTRHHSCPAVPAACEPARVGKFPADWPQ